MHPFEATQQIDMIFNRLYRNLEQVLGNQADIANLIDEIQHLQRNLQNARFNRIGPVHRHPPRLLAY
jgi:predicted metal-dependent enzyme (double-stranded beta helix superfamily)